MNDIEKQPIVITASIHDDISKRLVGSMRRMKEVASTTDLHKKGANHKLFKVSHQSMTKLLEQVESNSKENGTRAKHPVRKLVAEIAKTLNVMDSTLDLFDDGEMTATDMKQSSLAALSALKSARECLASDFKLQGSEPRVVVETIEVEAGVMKDAFKKSAQGLNYESPGARKTRKEKEEEERSEHERENLRKWQEKQDDVLRKSIDESKFIKLPNAKFTSDPFQVLRLPVVLTLEQLISAEQFKEAGIEVKKSIGMTPVLENQLMLAINLSANKKAGLSTNKASAVNMAYANTLVSILESKVHTKYSIIGGMAVGHVKSPGFIYYWLMPESALNKLLRVVSRKGGSFVIDDWGLAIKQ